MKKRKIRITVKRILSVLMSVLMVFSIIPLSNLVSSASEDVATPSDAESVTGYVTLEVNNLEKLSEDNLNPAGISYSIYTDEDCENLADTFALSADGKCYEDENEEVFVYENEDEITDESVIYYSALSGGTYYLKMDALLYDSEDGMETTGISYNKEVIEFTIEDESPVTLTTEVSILEETSEEDDASSDSDANSSDDSNSMEVITLSDDEDDTEEETEEVATSTDADEEGTEELIGVSALTTVYSLLSRVALTATSSTAKITNKGSYTVNKTTAGIFTATMNSTGTTYPAYCGDHNLSQPYTYTKTYAESTNTNVRRVMAYVLDKYGNSTSLSKNLRVRISLALYCAKHNTSHSLGNAIKSAAYTAYPTMVVPA